MKKLSIKGRITLWYAALLAVICAAVIWTLAMASDRAAMAYYRKTLESAAVILQDEMEVEHGRLEIDDDIDDVPNVYAALYDEAGALVYGRSWVSLPFEQGQVRLAHEGGHSWYVYDTLVSVPGHDSVWLRMHMSSDVSDSVRASVLHDGLWLLPLLAILALLGGYLITMRAFLPVHRMNSVADSIAHGEDLSARVLIEGRTNNDELGALGMTINGMLERLEQAFQREQQFTGDAAHELRTPLNRIITQSEYALSREDEAQKDEAIAHVLETAQDMNNLISDLLMLTRMDAGHMPREDDVELSHLVSEIAEDMTPLAEERHMTLRIQTVPCALRANRAMLARALINLIDNAVRYGHEGGEIVVSVSKNNHAAMLTVSDDGPGMSETDTQKAFTRFWRADKSRATPGTGIGLAIVSSCAKAHGGSAEVHSTPGNGASFTLTLPIKASNG